MRWLDTSRHPKSANPELPVEKAAEIKILSQNDPEHSQVKLCIAGAVSQEYKQSSIAKQKEESHTRVDKDDPE